MDIKDYNYSLAQNRSRYNDSLQSISEDYEEKLAEKDRINEIKTEKRKQYLNDEIDDIEKDYEVKISDLNRRTKETIDKTNMDRAEEVEELEKKNKVNLEETKRKNEKNIDELSKNYNKEIEDYKNTAKAKNEHMAKSYDMAIDKNERDARESYGILKDNIEQRWSGEKEKNISPLQRKIREKNIDLTDNIAKNNREKAELKDEFKSNLKDLDRTISEKNNLLKAKSEAFSHKLDEQAIEYANDREKLDKKYTTVIEDSSKSSNKGPGKIRAELTKKLKDQNDMHGLEKQEMIDVRQRQLNEVNRSTKEQLSTLKNSNEHKIENQNKYYNELLDKQDSINTQAVANMQKRFSVERVDLIKDSKDQLDFVSNRILDEYANKFDKLSLDYQRSLTQINDAHQEEREKLNDKMEVIRNRFDQQIVAEKENNERKLNVERKGMKDHIEKQAREHEKQLHKLESDYEQKMTKIRKDNIDKLNNLRQRYDEEIMREKDDHRTVLSELKMDSDERYNRLEEHRKNEVESLISFYESKLDEVRSSKS
ncbi:MAG: hypothetical protein H6622_16780 [Halobacteriovoraceae bacterium]|nr:hypothetical protein [Halobacteriovoraceae bacterium]